MTSKSVTISPAFSPVMRPWVQLSKLERRKEVVRVAKLKGGKAVTINLGPKVEPLLSSRKEPARFLGKKMNEDLNRADLRGVPLMMMLEATHPAGRLHLHGVYLDGGYPREQLHLAMRRGAGFIKGRSGSRQLYAESLYDADGWVKYIEKDARWTRRFLQAEVALSWVSRPMTQMARDHYEATRLGQKQAANTNGLVHDAVDRLGRSRGGPTSF